MCLTVSKQHCFWSEISDMVRLKESIVCFYHLISLTEQVKTVKNVLVMKIVLFIINVQENREKHQVSKLKTLLLKLNSEGDL